MKLVLVGTVHRDPAGKNRLLKKLEALRPAALSLEVSPASVELRRKWGYRWRKTFRDRLAKLSYETGLGPKNLMNQAKIRGVFEYLRLPYEYRAAMTYAAAQNCPVFLLDESEIAEAYLKRVESEILTEKNMALLLEAEQNLTLDEEVAAEYARAQNHAFKQKSWNDARLAQPEAWAKREARLSQKIRLLHQGLTRWAGRTADGDEFVRSLIIAPEAVAFVPKTVSFPAQAPHAYIGGWEHLVEDQNRNALFSQLQDLTPERTLCLDPGPETGR